MPVRPLHRLARIHLHGLLGLGDSAHLVAGVVDGVRKGDYLHIIVPNAIVVIAHLNAHLLRVDPGLNKTLAQLLLAILHYLLDNISKGGVVRRGATYLTQLPEV